MNTATDPETLREENLALVYRWMTTIGQPAWYDLIDDNMVLEFPYGPSVKVSPRIVGRAAIVEYVRSLLSRLGTFNWINMRIVGSDDPGEFFAEYEADLDTPLGEKYRQVYINRIRVRNGKVVFMREFWDPKRILDSMKGELKLAH